MITLRRTEIITYELHADIDVTDKESDDIRKEMVLLSELHGWTNVVTGVNDVLIETDEDTDEPPLVHKSPSWNT